MDVKALQGRAVVAISQADKLGHVVDVLFETSPLRVVALRLEADGPESVVPFEQVRSIGADAITVEDAAAAESGRGLAAYRDLPGIELMTSLKVVDENGTLRGKVETLDLDAETGRVIRIRTHKGGLMGVGVERHTMSAGAIRQVGAEVITVAVTP